MTNGDFACLNFFFQERYFFLIFEPTEIKVAAVSSEFEFLERIIIKRGEP